MNAAVTWGMLVVVAATAALTPPSPPAGGFQFTVLHTNDMHSHYEETCRSDADGSCVGGFARLRAALAAERARAVADVAPAVYLNAGDTFWGTPFYDVLRWEPAADFVGDLGVDVMVRTHAYRLPNLGRQWWVG